MDKISDKQRVTIALLTMYLIWGSTYLAVRIAIETIPPFLMTSSRLFLAGGVLFLYLWWRGSKLPTKEEWGNALLVGGLMLGGGVGGTAYAEQWVASGLAAVLVATVPLWTALIGRYWGKRPSRLEGIGLVLGFVGVIILNGEQNLQANRFGAFIMLLTPISWSLGSVLSQKLQLAKGGMAYASEMLGGAAVLLLMGLWQGEQLVGMPSVASGLAWFYLASFGSLIAFSAYMYLVEVDITLATSYAYVTPVIAVLLGMFVAQETISLVGVVAMGIILGSVFFLTQKRGTAK